MTQPAPTLDRETLVLLAAELHMPPFMVVRRLKEGDRTVREALAMIQSWDETGIHFEEPLIHEPMTMAVRERLFGKEKKQKPKGKQKKGVAAGPLYYKRSY